MDGNGKEKSSFSRLISNVDMMIFSSLNSEIGSIEITRKKEKTMTERTKRQRVDLIA